MKILVTGNAGFIGGFLNRKLIDQGYELVGLDINPYGPREELGHFIIGDILNYQDVLKAADGAEVIINLAAKHHDFGISRSEFFRVNEEGTANILRCASQLGIKKFIFYSTVAVYGEQNIPSTEETSPSPVNDYGASKLAAEKVVYNWVKEDSSRQAVILRPTVVFGPYNYANMFNLINNIYKKRFLFVGKGENLKSVGYVENLVEATIFLLENLKSGLEIYNYSDYPQMTSTRIAEIIAQYLSRNIPKVRIPLGVALSMGYIFDILAKVTGYNFPITAKRMKKFNTDTHHTSDKIRELGFKPKIDLTDGFKRMVEWYMTLKINENMEN